MVAVVEHDYKNIVPHIDIDRSLDSLEIVKFEGHESQLANEFRKDMEEGNDTIEMHLIKTKSYKEALVLRLKSKDSGNEWKDLLRDEQKTFGGSKIFYMNTDCSKLIVLGVPNEIKSKLNLVVSRINKTNEKISRINSRIKKENTDLFSIRIRSKDTNKEKEELINFINQNLKV